MLLLKSLIPCCFRKLPRLLSNAKKRSTTQGVANLLWAYATMGIVDKHLFSSFVPTAATLIDSYENQGLAIVAWAYAVANVDASTRSSSMRVLKGKVVLIMKNSGSSISGICGRQRKSQILACQLNLRVDATTPPSRRSDSLKDARRCSSSLDWNQKKKFSWTAAIA
jgi:hypothetical protein